MEIINFKTIERKWQKAWAEKKAFEVNEKSAKKKFSVVCMYPYPSGAGLHMGHALNYSIADIFARFKRMQGYNVLHPMGFDSFGLPAENAAIKAKSHPKKFTEDAIANYIGQMKNLGLSYDWSRMIESHKPEYYKWDQWIFLKMIEKGLAYRKRAPVNWCPKCGTVLANEQVVGGKCWRHDEQEVEIKHLEQWFFKTTAYADELFSKLDTLNDWPENIKALQRNWIGKSEGAEVDFDINGKLWSVFTTRLDTLFGVTFLVVSAQHSELMSLVSAEQKKKVETFVQKMHSVKEEDAAVQEKEGIFTGSYAIHPLTKEKIPVYAGNFVLPDYGTGMVMGVPAHDERDWAFAKKYKLPTKQVVMPYKEVTSGKDSIREDKETIERDSVFGVVKHWSEDKYFLLDWKNFGWKSFIIGGVEKNENPEEAVIREVKEETGYQNIKKVSRINFDTQVKFFAAHKDVNRKARYSAFLLELGSSKHILPKAEEVKNHVGNWVDGKNVRKYLNLENNIQVWEYLTNGGYAYTDFGVLINSGAFDRLGSEEAKGHIMQALLKVHRGRPATRFRLKDWLISRQRFWGTPIPIIYCGKCGAVPVPEKELPVLLPENIIFQGTENPLTGLESFVSVKCPKCKGPGRRETDTMDTFVNSSWYFLRYCDPHNGKAIFDKEKVKYWMPMDLYIGGKEHACLHLIYFRFYTKFLRDLGLLEFDEPALRLFNQGILQGPDGRKMSKSLGNVIVPETVSEKYGIDTARLFLVSVAAPDKDINWSEEGVQGSLRFIVRLFEYIDNVKVNESSAKIAHKVNSAIKKVTEEIENFRYNFAIINLRELFGAMEKEDGIGEVELGAFVKMLSPFVPHVAEELWSKMGNKNLISLEDWPEADESKINNSLDAAEAAMEKTVSDISTVLKIVADKGKEGERVFVYVLPQELGNYNEKALTERLGKLVKVFSVSDKSKYDPEGKSSKVKPGRPGIYVE